MMALGLTVRLMWRSSTSLQSVLEALGHLGTAAAPALFEALLDSASEKASTLEQHNTSLGGHGIRQRRLAGGGGPRAARKWTGGRIRSVCSLGIRDLWAEVSVVHNLI